MRKPRKSKDKKVSLIVLVQVQSRGGDWAAYEHSDGNRQFLKFGPGCKFNNAPECYPENNRDGIGSEYLFIGTVDNKTGMIQSYDHKVRF